MPEPSSTLGARLRRARLDAGMSQTDLSAASGIPKPTLSRYENGHVSPSLQTLQRLASSLGVTESSLLGESPGLNDAHTPNETFLQVLAEHGITFASVTEAREAAEEVAKRLKRP